MGKLMFFFYLFQLEPTFSINVNKTYLALFNGQQIKENCCSFDYPVDLDQKISFAL